MNEHWRRGASTIALLAAVVVLGAASGGAADRPADPGGRGASAIRSMAGCFLVDYSYTEVESFRPGYVRDPRVYDVNREKSVKEWIQAEVLSPRRIRLERVLFATDLAGAVRPGSAIRHQAEDWEYDAPFLYDFAGRRRWEVKDLRGAVGLWTRRVTNLDDGLRYQCAAPWSADTAYPEWSCSNYAPVPGRETRDMRRSDYNALARGTRIVVYGGSWLERQENVKTIHAEGVRTSLVRETGKNWYVRLPDAECAAAQTFASPRQAFWALLREVWDSVLDGAGPFVETVPPGGPPRFMKVYEVEEDYIGRD